MVHVVIAVHCFALCIVIVHLQYSTGGMPVHIGAPKATTIGLPKLVKVMEPGLFNRPAIHRGIDKQTAHTTRPPPTPAH